MITRGKLILMVFAALLVALGLGFGWGASGCTGLETSLDETQQLLDVSDARVQILEARVGLYSNNFGEASRHFEDAKSPLRRVRDRYKNARRNDAASRIDTALGQIDEAQRLSGKLDQAANSKAGEALEAIRSAVGR